MKVVGFAGILFAMMLTPALATDDQLGRPPINALNAEQDAIFPKSAKFDRALYEHFSISRTSRDVGRHGLGKKAGERYQHDIQSAGGPICRTFLKYERANGGAMVGGCDFPQSAQKDSESFVHFDWKSLDPIAHLELVKDIFLAEYQGPWDVTLAKPTHNDWSTLGPVVRQLLIEQRITLVQGRLDVDGNGVTETVYGLTVMPFAACILMNGTKSADITYLYIAEPGPLKDSFNQSNLSGMPFSYHGTTYLSHSSDGVILDLGTHPDGCNSTGLGCDLILDAGAVCEFGEE